jgi:glycosyltransferase 2 family protein
VRCSPDRGLVLVALRRAALYVLKLSLGLAVLVWLYGQGILDLDVLFKLEVDARFITLIVIASALVVAACALLSLRLMLLLQLQGIFLPVFRIIGLTMLGSFFGSILPGLLAGDVVKAMYMVRGSEKGKSKAVAAVIADRVIGLYGLFVLATVGSLVAWLAGEIDPAIVPILLIAPSLTILGSAALAVLVAFPHGDGTFVAALVAKSPRIARGLMLALGQFGKGWVCLAQAIGISVICHGLVVVTFILMGILIRDSLTLGQHLVADPLAMVLNAVPLAPGGLGITEGALAHLFRNFGSANGALIGLLGRATQYLVFTIGALIAMTTMRASGAMQLEA